MTVTVLAEIRGAIACDAFWSMDDGLHHAVVLGGDGGLTDIAYGRAGSAQARGVIGRAERARDLTAFWSEGDDVRNVIAVTADGLVTHLRQKGAEAWESSRRRDVPDALRVAGYDVHHHGIVLTGAGRITDEPFHGITAAVQQMFVKDTAAALAQRGTAAAVRAPTVGADDEPPILVAVVPGAVDIAALWADGPNRFVISADGEGAVEEFGYGVNQPETRRVLATIPGVRRISATYLGDPATGRCVVALTRDGEVHVLRYGIEGPRAGAPVVTRAATDVGCFTTADGRLRIVLLSEAEVVEVAVD